MYLLTKKSAANDIYISDQEILVCIHYLREYGNYFDGFMSWKLKTSVLLLQLLLQEENYVGFKNFKCGPPGLSAYYKTLRK